MKGIFIFLLLFPHLLMGQESKGVVLKTLVLQDALFRNPNIIAERPLSRHFSMELLVAVRFGDFFNDGREAPVPAFQACKGLTIGLAGRYYLARTKKIPNSWYVSAMLRYNDTRIERAEIQEKIMMQPRIVNLKRRGPEGGIVIGRQFVSARNLTADFYFGCGTYIQYHSETYISGPWSDTYSKKIVRTTRPYLGWSLGYFIRKKDTR